MENEKFEIKDLSDVNSVMATIRNIEKKKAENEEFATKEIERTQSWLEGMNKNLDSSIEYYTGLLLEYYYKEKTNNPRMKNLNVPNGKLSFRTTKKITYPEDKMIEYLKQNHKDMVEEVVTEKFNKTEVKKLLDGNIDKETGELLEWVTIEESTNYSIKTVE